MELLAVAAIGVSLTGVAWAMAQHAWQSPSLALRPRSAANLAVGRAARYAHRR